jgi:hypothetical protein
MRVLVTAEAIGLLWAVLLAMTGRTKRHQLVVVVFTRVVCVKNLVTLLTGKSMFATGIFQVGKLAHMALTTLCWLQRSRRHFVKSCINLWQLSLGSENKPWLKESSQGDNTSCNKNNLKFQDLISSVYLAGQLFRS